MALYLRIKASKLKSNNMKKLTREQMKSFAGGVGGTGTGTGGTGTSGGTGTGGTGEVVCLFISSTCGNLCYDVNTAPYYYKSCAAAFSGPPGFNPSCHYTYQTVTSCGA